MKMYFVGNDVDLVKKFSTVDSLTVEESYVTIDSVLLPNVTADILVVSDRVTTLNQFISYSEGLRKRFKHIFFMVTSENMNFNTKHILAQHDIIMIPPKNTPQKIVDFVCSNVFENFHMDNNIVVFFGADTKVGTTMLAQTVAENIAKSTGKKVFLGFMDGSPGTDYFKGSFSGNIDEIKLKMLTKVLNISDIYTECREFGNLFVLEGVRNYLYRREYNIEDIELFLDIVSENFDVIILDAGSNIELALCLGSLTATKNRYLVTTPQKKSTESFKILHAILDKLLISSFSLVINKHLSDFGKPFEIADRFNSYSIAGCIPFVENAWQAESENRVLYSYGDKKYCAKVDELTNVIMNSLGVESKEGKKKSKGLFNWGE